MAEPDDIDKLLREIDAMNAGPGPAAGSTPNPPARTPHAQIQPAQPTDRHRGRAQWTAVAAGGAGVVGLLTGTVLGLLPFVSTLETGIGAALGGAIVAFVSGPPTWFIRK